MKQYHWSSHWKQNAHHCFASMTNSTFDHHIDNRDAHTFVNFATLETERPPNLKVDFKQYFYDRKQNARQTLKTYFKLNHTLLHWNRTARRIFKSIPNVFLFTITLTPTRSPHLIFGFIPYLSSSHWKKRLPFLEFGLKQYFSVSQVYVTFLIYYVK